ATLPVTWGDHHRQPGRLRVEARPRRHPETLAKPLISGSIFFDAGLTMVAYDRARVYKRGVVARTQGGFACFRLIRRSLLCVRSSYRMPWPPAAGVSRQHRPG